MKIRLHYSNEKMHASYAITLVLLKIKTLSRVANNIFLLFQENYEIMKVER